MKNKIFSTYKHFVDLHNKYLPKNHELNQQSYFNLFKETNTLLKFQTTQHIVENLINWDDVPNDPLYQLTFPQPDMIPDDIRQKIRTAIKKYKNDPIIFHEKKKSLGHHLNPSPNGQPHNVPKKNGKKYEGMQHKYDETVLFFPGHGQQCFANCTYCFRWANFVYTDEKPFLSFNPNNLFEYISITPELTDVLFTGGDPATMSANQWKPLLTPFLNDSKGLYQHVSNIRIGTKSLSFDPYRWVNRKDTKDMLSMIESLVLSGKHVSIMAHCSHWKELEHPVTEKAIKNLRNVGCEIRSQSPLVKNINDSSDVWIKNWKKQIQLGIIPYYFFVERDTGPKKYFELPLAQCLDIYNGAVKHVSGLGRSVRGPSMSSLPGKVHVVGVTEPDEKGEKFFLLRFLQARIPEWCDRIFLAKYDEKATWLNHLKPAHGDKFFFEDQLNEILDLEEKGNQDESGKIQFRKKHPEYQLDIYKQ